MAAQGVNMLEEVPQCKATIKNRFSSIRLRKAVKKFNPIQMGHIIRHNLTHMINIPEHLMIPPTILQWLVDHTSYGGTGEFFFKHKEKQFWFTKDIVDKVFGFQNGFVPYKLESNDPKAVSEVDFLRSQYLDPGQNTIKVSKVESIMLGSNDERVFLRSFIMFFITTVLCPSIYNFVNPKYLYSLRDDDILLVEYFDFGTLCLHNLFQEMDNWKDKIFMNVGDFNRTTWIGGCLPVLGVVYIDFVDFNGNDGNIDYSLPRMQYITNADFKHLHNLDRNRRSRKAYGVLPIRDIAATPYGVPMLINEAPQLPEPNEALPDDAIVNEVLINEAPQLPEPNEPLPDDAIVNEVLINEAPQLPEPNEPLPDEVGSAEIIEVSTSAEFFSGSSQSHDSSELDVGFDAIHESPLAADGYTYPEQNPAQQVQLDAYEGIDNLLQLTQYVGTSSPTEIEDIRIAENVAENVANISTPMDCSLHNFQDSTVRAENQTEPGEVHATAETLYKGDGLFSIVVSYADSPAAQSTSIAEAFVHETPTNGSDSIAVSQGNVNSARDTVFEPTFVQSSFDKKNRKKRAAKTNSPDPSISNLVTNHNVNAFYSKFMRNNFYTQSESPTFIQIEGCSVRYDTFFSSFKVSGNVAEDVMCAQALLFNEDAKLVASKKPFIKRHMFSSSTSAKLMNDPSLFDKTSVVAEFSSLSREMDFASIDLLHLPCVLVDHWVLVCVNPLFGTINFFDPVCMTSELEQQAIMKNVATNLNTVLKELNVHGIDLEKFKPATPPNYPSHSLMLYVMLLCENFNGKMVKHFSNDIVPNYRMLKAYNMFHSPKNEVLGHILEKTKKRRKL